MMIRVGFGFDVHQLVEGRELWLGGVQIPHSVGALGHSDADVLLHAVCDALLGAVALGDIGKHFPDTDQRWKGADSKVLLKAVVELLDERGWTVGNVDASLVLERPKIMSHVPAMQRIIAELLRVGEDAVSIKATTNERMGYVGREEGVCAYAVALVQRKG
jgi:2-C-methyl-D-erythritol 2,4-cyclodiphosphate synthase